MFEMKQYLNFCIVRTFRTKFGHPSETLREATSTLLTLRSWSWQVQIGINHESILEEIAKRLCDWIMRLHL